MRRKWKPWVQFIVNGAGFCLLSFYVSPAISSEQWLYVALLILGMVGLFIRASRAWDEL